MTSSGCAQRTGFLITIVLEWMSKDVEKRGHQNPARKMNWDKVRREKLLIKVESPRTGEDGRAELSPEDRRRVLGWPPRFSDWQKGDKK